MNKIEIFRFHFANRITSDMTDDGLSSLLKVFYMSIVSDMS